MDALYSDDFVEDNDCEPSSTIIISSDEETSIDEPVREGDKKSESQDDATKSGGKLEDDLVKLISISTITIYNDGRSSNKNATQDHNYCFVDRRLLNEEEMIRNMANVKNSTQKIQPDIEDCNIVKGKNSSNAKQVSNKSIDISNDDEDNCTISQRLDKKLSSAPPNKLYSIPRIFIKFPLQCDENYEFNNVKGVLKSKKDIQILCTETVMTGKEIQTYRKLSSRLLEKIPTKIIFPSNCYPRYKSPK